MGCIASILKKQFPQYSYQFHYFLNNEWKPILLINTESLLIRIMPTICESLFFPARLGPSRNSLRPAFLKLNHEPQPTPFYNNSILMDASYQNHVAHIYKAIKEEGPVAETIQLLKRWVLLRDIHDISPFLVSMLFIGFLNNSYQIISKEKKSLNLSRKWSCFQLFRVFLEFMGNLNVSDAIILCNDQEIQKRIGKILVKCSSCKSTDSFYTTRTSRFMEKRYDESF